MVLGSGASGDTGNEWQGFDGTANAFDSVARTRERDAIESKGEGEANQDLLSLWALPGAVPSGPHGWR